MGKPQRLSASDVQDGGFRFCSWDLETSGLNASFGTILCGAIKPAGKPAEIYRVDQFSLYRKEPWNDMAVVEAIRTRLEDFHVAVSYNGFNFDLPMLNTRLVAQHKRVLSPVVKHVDLISVSRRRMRLSSNSLETLLDTMQAKERKTRLSPEVWKRAVRGEKRSLDAICRHCKADVVTLEEVFNRLIPFLDIQFRLIK